MKSTDLVDNQYIRTDLPAFGPGDEVKVHVKVVEGNKERVQIFQGNVIRRQGSGLRTVREMVWLHEPAVAACGSRDDFTG